MNYELAEKLKDAGFPQEYKLGQWACPHGLDRIMENSCICYGDDLFYAPTLSELIEACGDRFDNLRRIHTGEFVAETIGREPKTGSTPEEAVANLWLALNKKDA